MKKKNNNPVPDPLRVLILEDNPSDIELVVCELQRAGIEFIHEPVDDKKQFAAALNNFQPNIILSDFKMPQFDGLAALEMTRLKAPDIPFIFVSGSIGEEKAIETLSQGATDYIFKDNLKRLGPAVKKVVEDAHLKQEKRNVDEELHRHVEEMRLLAEAADSFVHINDLDEIYKYLADTIRGISGADYLLLSLYDEKLQAIRPKIVTGIEPFAETIRRRFNIDLMQAVFYLKDMRPDDFSDFISRRLLPVRDGLYGLANRKMPRAVSRTIEKMLNIGSTHNMGFSWENQLFGGLTVFFKKGNDLKNASQIEALVNLAAVAIKRLLAEKSLRAGEEKYRTILDQAADAVFIHDETGRILDVNRKACQNLGYTREEMLSKSIGDLDPEAIQTGKDKLWKAILAGEKRSFESRQMRKDGSAFPVEVTLGPVLLPQGPVVIGIVRDISERKKAEEAFQREKAYLEQLIESAPEAIVLGENDGRVLRVNSEFEKMFGYTAEEAVGQLIDDLIAPAEYKQEATSISGTLSQGGKISLETVRRRKDGSLLHVSLVGSPIIIGGQQVAIYGIYRDISDRKRTEEALQLEKSYLEQLIESAPEGIIIVNQKECITRANSEFLKMFGYAEPEVIGRNIDDLIIPSHLREEALTMTRTSVAGNKFLTESVRKRKDGTLIDVSIIGSPIIIDGHQAAIYGIYRDISERTRTEEAFQLEKSYLEQLVETAPEGIIVLDQKGCITRANSEFLHMFGYAEPEVIGRNIDNLIVPPHLREEALTMTGTVVGGRKFVTDSVRKRKDGTLIDVSIIGSPIIIGGQQAAIYGIYRDISERTRAAERMKASLKEKEVLLQEIHHRVKNNLQIISGLLTLQADRAGKKSLEEIFKDSQDRIRSIALIHEKLYQSKNLAEIDFSQYLRVLVDNLLISHGITAGRVTARYDMEPISFTIEKAIPLGLIANELVTNALKHAFPGERKGEIHISLRECRGTARCAPTPMPSTYELTIANNGISLPEDFSLQDQKSMGMHLVSMLTKQLQAELAIDRGAGTKFSIHIKDEMERVDWHG